jgi:hypothetical protein
VEILEIFQGRPFLVSYILGSLSPITHCGLSKETSDQVHALHRDRKSEGTRQWSDHLGWNNPKPAAQARTRRLQATSLWNR